MFAELLGRSCFSFLRAASHPEEMLGQAAKLELGALALCDLNGLYGSVRALTASRTLGQKVIVGAELSLANAEIASSSRAFPEQDGLWGIDIASRKSRILDPVTLHGEPSSVALLVKDREGYANLCKLLSLAHAGLPKGQSALELEALCQHHRGLVALLPAPRVPFGQCLPPPKLLSILKEVFNERAFLGIYRHLDSFDHERLNCVQGWAEHYALPVVATARALFHERSRKPLFDVMCCVREGLTLEQAGSLLEPNAEAHLRSELQMRQLFPEHPHWIDVTDEIAQDLRFCLSELEYAFPCELDPHETADTKLRILTFEGLKRRYPGGVSEAVLKQVEKELALIQQLEVAPYFLSTWEIVEIARSRRILCQGRGSAANSAVCYALGITAVDPTRSSLLFERFMSMERQEPPDIDIDFEHERREEVIQEIYKRYGRERAAMVSEVICYRGKSALREVSKAFGLSLEQVDRLGSSISHWDSAEAVQGQHLQELGFDPKDARLKQVLELACAMQGMPRHLSIHVGGFVLSAQPLFEVAPIEPARMPGRSVIPWDKDDIEELGFFKIDVLGLGMLTAIRKALTLIYESGGLRDPGAIEGEGFDPLEVVTRIPPEDPTVYRMISRADTIGVFQIESRAQMSMLPRLRPQRFYDLVVEVAIVRPGPIHGGMVHPYLRRRNGEEPITSPHPDLWPILERTLGVPLFQEQVMQLSITGAGYSGGEADQLRRDMAAWRKSGRLLQHRDRLLAGFAKKGISAEFGEALFEQIKGFGDYGFPESHAASFALLVYASAWIKAHYPAHFACALLNSQPMGFYSASSIIQDAQRHHVEVRDVDVQQSRWDSTLEFSSNASSSDARARGVETSEAHKQRTLSPKERQKQSNTPQRAFRSEGHGENQPGAKRALRLGLRVIKGLGQKAGRRIEMARDEQPFESIGDLRRRAQLKKDELEALAEAGALEALISGRRQALWEARLPGLPGLFENLDLQEPTAKLPALPASEQLVLDYGRKGLCVSDHPLQHLRSWLTRRRVLKASEILNVEQGARVQVAGVVICRQRPATASGVVFFTIEDETGYVNLVVWRAVYEKFHHLARHSHILLVRGRVERQQPGVTEKEGKEARASALASAQPQNKGFFSPPLPPAEVAVIHLIAESFERIASPQELRHQSRDFH